MKMDNDCLKSIINDNDFESQILSDWLVRNKKTTQQMFDECIEKLKNGQYKTGLLKNDETLDRFVCRSCGIALFKELAYQYRSDISNDDLFGEWMSI
jgi:rubrerythrin